MRHQISAVSVIFLLSLAAAVVANPASAPDAGTDYAGRPIQATAPKLPLPTPAQQQEVQRSVRDIHFDFDRADLRMEDRQILESNAQWLKAHPEVYITIEGDADERGDIVYNVALSDKRAIATRDALLQQGVNPQQIVFATGWGKLYPICIQSDESCWRQNRRAHFARW